MIQEKEEVQDVTSTCFEYTIRTLLCMEVQNVSGTQFLWQNFVRFVRRGKVLHKKRKGLNKNIPRREGMKEKNKRERLLEQVLTEEREKAIDTNICKVTSCGSLSFMPTTMVRVSKNVSETEREDGEKET